MRNNSKPKRRPSAKPDVRGDKSRPEAIKDKKVNAKDNDPSWYLVNGQLAKDVADFSYNNALGDLVQITHGRVYDSSSTWDSNNTFRLPGIASVLTAPSIGPSFDATSPVNVASRNIYAFVRHANSGHANYDPADLMIYLLAVDSVQSYWSWMVRAYGVTQAFSQRNRYVGDALLRSMGVDPSIRSSLSDFRAYINQFAIKASVLAVPNTMTYFMRHAWMYQNVYTDEDNPKAQMFLFTPAYLYKFALDSQNVGSLQVAPVCLHVSSNGGWSSSIDARTLNDIRDIGDSLINAMLSQEDVGIISGDILKAYGSDKLYRFNQIAEDYAVVPVFSEEVLGQFHNLNMVGRTPLSLVKGKKVLSTDSLAITQDTTIGSGILKYQPEFGAALDLNYSHFLDTWKSEATPEDSLVYSRLMTWLNISGDSYEYGGTTISAPACRLSSCGSEIVLDVIINTINQQGDLISFTSRVNGNSTSPQQYNTMVYPYSTKFNQFPLLAQFGPSGNLLSVMGEMSNYTVINENELYALHSTALLSMFGVPYNW